MSITELEASPGAGTVDSWQRCHELTVVAMSALNLATVALVEVIREMLDTEAWCGSGITPEHWVRWKANVSKHRADGLLRIARRRDELPCCWAAFTEGRLTEDAMARIARRVPAERDRQVAGLAPLLMISQLTRLLSSLPELPDPDAPPPGERQRDVQLRTHADGWGEGHLVLPPDEWAVFLTGATAARDAEFRDRADLPVDAEVTEGDARKVTWADAVVRMASEATDGLDANLRRTGHRGERHQVVLHHELDAEGRYGPGQLHLGGLVTDAVARYLACDARVIVNIYRDGKLVGITPSERTPNRRLRRCLERRDGGCAHPLCDQRRWLHAHHLQHWEDGGPTVPSNLVCLCPLHHRQLHHGDFTVEGNPEEGTLRFTDRFGRAIAPPGFGADVLPPPAAPTKPLYETPCHERLSASVFTWS